MLIRSVVHHQVNQHAHAALPAAVSELHEVANRPIPRIDPVVIADVVAVILPRRRLERHQPHRRHPHALQVVQAANQPLKVADTVAVCIHIGSNRQAVDNSVLVPKVIDHSYRYESSIPSRGTLVGCKNLPGGSAE